jgi:hypothetical protein
VEAVEPQSLESRESGRGTAHYQEYRLAEGASPKTVNLEVGTLHAILRRHRVWAEIQQDIRMLPTLDDVSYALAPCEEVALLSACLKKSPKSAEVGNAAVPETFEKKWLLR